MDPITAVGLITGVLGLFPLCADGFSFIEGIIEARKNVTEEFVRIRIQKGVLSAALRSHIIVLIHAESGVHG